MNLEQWEQLQGLFHEAVQLDSGQRRAFLDQRCSSDLELRQKLEQMLAAESKLSPTFLETPALQQLPGDQTTSSMPRVLPSGTRLGPYEIVALIGAGGMGEVYRARDTRLNRSVAIKIIPQHFATDPQRRQRFEREARAISSLQHPNICTLHDVGSQDGTSYLVMEYLEGETLAERLRQGLLPLDQVLRYSTEIADALDLAHRNGIVHRDLKPANIFLTTQGGCKVLDFGLAKLEEPEHAPEISTLDANDPNVLTTPGLAMGTVAYMSPEQAQGKELDRRTDVFSLGTVLYEMTTGKVAFPGNTPALVFKAILDEAPPAPTKLVPSLPAQLDQIVEKALEKDRDLRYQSAADLRTDLKRLKRETESGQFAKPGSSQRSLAATPKSSRKKWMVFVALAIASLLAIGLGLLWFKSRQAAAQPVRWNLENMKVSRLTDSGKVGTATISPDGRFVAYTLKETGRSSLWMRQIATQSALQLAPPSDKGYFGSLTFSPDSDYLYFAQQRSDITGTYEIFSVPTLGGTPKLVIQDAHSSIAISPDGKNIVFIHGHSETFSQLVTAHADGSERRVLLDLVKEKLGVNESVDAPSWSPDGKFIAAAVRRAEGWGVFLAPVTRGKPSIFPFANDIKSIAWLPDQRGLLVTSGGQIWLQPFPNGTPQRITNDLNFYHALAVTADSKQFSAMQLQGSNTIVVGPAEDPDKGTPVRTTQSDGWGLAWTPDGKILSSDHDSQFWLSSPDGRDRAATFRIEGGELFPGGFSLCGDGGFLILNREFRGISSIWRVDRMGSGLAQLTQGPSDLFPDCSPDGKWVIYYNEKMDRLARIPTAGGPGQNLLEDNTWLGRYSPDGKHIGMMFSEGKGDDARRTKVGITDLDGHILRKFDLPPGKIPWVGATWTLQWTPDAKGLVIGMEWADVINLWYQPVSGGKPRQLTHFPDSVMRAVWSPDGKRIALMRHSASSDAVLFSNFR